MFPAYPALYWDYPIIPAEGANPYPSASCVSAFQTSLPLVLGLLI